MPPTLTRDPNRPITGLTVYGEFVLTEITRHFLEHTYYSTAIKHPADEALAGSNQDSIEIIVSYFQMPFIPLAGKSRKMLSAGIIHNINRAMERSPVPCAIEEQTEKHGAILVVMPSGISFEKKRTIQRAMRGSFSWSDKIWPN